MECQGLSLMRLRHRVRKSCPQSAGVSTGKGKAQEVVKVLTRQMVSYAQECGSTYGNPDLPASVF